MNKLKLLSNLFLIAAILLSDVMCAAVAAEYVNMQWGIRYMAYSAPAEVAFFLAIPYLAAIAVCLVLFAVLRRKALNRTSQDVSEK